MTKDKHLNVFQCYVRDGELPIENNVSRGYAILLQEHPALLMMLINRIQEGVREIQYPTELYSVNFQKEVHEFEDAEKVIGISLTTSQFKEPYNYGNLFPKVDQKRITDISIVYDDTIIIIEVKRTAEDCRNQLEEQVVICAQSIEQTYQRNMGSIKKSYVEITWEDVLGFLNQYIALCGNRTDRLVSDYYTFLETNYPNWIPVQTLDKLDVGEWQYINKRMRSIMDEYMLKYNSQNQSMIERIGGVYAIPVDFTWASEADIWYERDDLELQNKVIIGIWVADTCGQYWKLIKSSPNLDFAMEKNNVLHLKDGSEIKLRVRPYLKLCHFNRGIMSTIINKNKDIYSNVDIKAFADRITGKRNRTDWQELKDIIENAKIFDADEIERFKNEFKNNFEDTKRNYLTASVGFEVYAYIPYEKAQQKEKKNRLEMANLINMTLIAMKHYIK